jgi:hypothetical protein
MESGVDNPHSEEGHHVHVRHVEEFLNTTDEARRLSERDRDYTNNHQWTDEERSKLAARKQAPITNNRIKPKVEGLKGLLIQRRTDPKAYPRNRKDEKASHAITDALRYVADNTDLDAIELDVADNLFVEGYGAAIVETEEENGEQAVVIRSIDWDRLYYDPYSRRPDFKDARYMGIVVWMDAEDAKEKFPDSEDLIDAAMSDNAIDETFDDKPNWIDGVNRKRLRVCQEFYIDKGVWKMCFFTVNGFLSEPEDSPYLNEKGEPECPIEAVGAYIDRENQRHGEVRYMIDLQDEINHRRSKALHLSSTRQTVGRKGAIPDVVKMKREFAKPDGHIEYEGERGDFEVLSTGDMTSAQLKLLQQAQEEMNQTSFNAQLAGEGVADQSGKAISLLQQGGMLETLPIYNGIMNWKTRMYRQIWHRIKQHWTTEKWIRVTDNQKDLKWVGLNVQVPLAEHLQDIASDKSKSNEERQQAVQVLQALMQAQDPRLQQSVSIKNPVPELDMDIILENAPDSINTQAEQFQLLAQLAASRPEVPFSMILELSQLRDKDEIMEQIKQREQQMAQAQQQALQAQQQAQAQQLQTSEQNQQFAQQLQSMAMQLKAQETQAKIGESAAKTGKLNMESINQQLENMIIAQNPSRLTSIST